MPCTGTWRIAMGSWRLLLASSLTMVGCSEAIPRDAVIAEQRRIEGAVSVGTSAQEATRSLAALGYSCHETPGDASSGDGAAGKLAVTDCAKPVQGKTEYHVCVRRTDSQVKDVRYGFRPLCASQ